MNHPTSKAEENYGTRFLLWYRRSHSTTSPMNHIRYGWFGKTCERKERMSRGTESYFPPTYMKIRPTMDLCRFRGVSPFFPLVVVGEAWYVYIEIDVFCSAPSYDVGIYSSPFRAKQHCYLVPIPKRKTQTGASPSNFPPRALSLSLYTTNFQVCTGTHRRTPNRRWCRVLRSLFVPVTVAAAAAAVPPP
jgi:hypothetical protein